MTWAESETLEFKASFSEWKEAVQTLCAFANAKGGMVAVGIDDAGQPTGLEIGKGSIEDLLNKIRLNTDPVLYPSVATRTFGLETYLEIQVPESEAKPVFAFDRAFVRVGKTTQKLSASAVRQMVLRHGPGHFDEALVEGSFAVSHLLAQRPGIKALVEDPTFWREGQSTTALHLSVNESVAGYPQAGIQAGLFKGETTAVFLDMKQFEAPLLVALDDAMDFVQKHLTMEVVLDGSPRRKEIWAVPLAAVREALINAVVHRDYADPGQVQVRIFADRLEIWSPGLLASGVALENLETMVRSVPRNRLLASLFRQVGVIESFGTGFQRMAQACVEAGNPAPQYLEAAGAFVVRFPFHAQVQVIPQVEALQGMREGMREGVNAGVNAGVNEGVNEGVLLALIRENPDLRLPQLAARLGTASKTVERWLASLRHRGAIEFHGSPKTGGYRVTSASSVAVGS